MDYKNEVELDVRDMLSQAEIMASAAEASAELSRALLQLRREVDDANPILIPYNIAVDRVTGAYANLVMNMIRISCIDGAKVADLMCDRHLTWLRTLVKHRKKEDQTGESIRWCHGYDYDEEDDEE